MLVFEMRKHTLRMSILQEGCCWCRNAHRHIHLAWGLVLHVEVHEHTVGMSILKKGAYTGHSHPEGELVLVVKVQNTVCRPILQEGW